MCAILHSLLFYVPCKVHGDHTESAGSEQRDCIPGARPEAELEKALVTVKLKTGDARGWGQQQPGGGRARQEAERGHLHF